MTHLHVPRHRLPLALWDLHRALAVGAPFELQVLEGEYEGSDLPGDDVGGRYFAGWTPSRLVDQVVGAGFDVDPGSLAVSGDEVRLRAVRARTLADTVTTGMRLLVCGINPSPYSADVGIGYARPGNRFWPAALAAGIVGRDRDPIDALIGHGMGMTDFVKRATRTAAEVTAEEYRPGSPGSSAWCSGYNPVRCASRASPAGGRWSTRRRWPACSPCPSADARPTSCRRPAASMPGPRWPSSPSISPPRPGSRTAIEPVAQVRITSPRTGAQSSPSTGTTWSTRGGDSK